MDEPLRQRLGVDARDGQREQIFDELVIVESVRTRIEQAASKPRAVSARSLNFIRHVRMPVHAAPCCDWPEQLALNHSIRRLGSGHAVAGTVAG